MPTKLTLEDRAAAFKPLGDCLQSALALAAIQLGDDADLYLDAAKIALVNRLIKNAGISELREAGDDEAAGKLISIVEEMIEGVRKSVRDFSYDENPRSPAR